MDFDQKSVSVVICNIGSVVSARPQCYFPHTNNTNLYCKTPSYTRHLVPDCAFYCNSLYYLATTTAELITAF